MTTDLMTPAHPRWDEFAEALGGPDGCDFNEDGTEWHCNGTHCCARRVLAEMGFSPQALSRVAGRRQRRTHIRLSESRDNISPSLER
jgi:hypothetical protein